MENKTSGPVDKDNGLLVVRSSPASGHDAATQTPQPMRHTTKSRRPQNHSSSRLSSSSDDSTAYEDSSFCIPSIGIVDGHRDMPIPDVIIDSSNVFVDSCTDTSLLTEEFNTTNQEQLSGETNLAFESKEEKVRFPSAGSFRQVAKACRSTGPVFFQPSEHLLVPINSLDRLNDSAEKFNRRYYYSLPKAPRKKNQDGEIQLRSQPPTPQMKRAREAAIGTDTPNIWIIPREHSSTKDIPALVAKCVTSEGAPGLYAISGRSTVVSNGFSEPVLGLYEMHLLPPVETSAQSTPKSVRKFESTTMPASVDRQRRCRQWCTDTLSLLLTIIGFIAIIATPGLIVPLFYVGPKLFIPHALIFIASGTMGAVTLVFAGITGNVVWWYDEKSKKLKPRLHCGRGPMLFFWGNAFYDTEKRKQKEFVV